MSKYLLLLLQVVVLVGIATATGLTKATIGEKGPGGYHLLKQDSGDDSAKPKGNWPWNRKRVVIAPVGDRPIEQNSGDDSGDDSGDGDDLPVSSAVEAGSGDGLPVQEDFPAEQTDALLARKPSPDPQWKRARVGETLIPNQEGTLEDALQIAKGYTAPLVLGWFRFEDKDAPLLAELLLSSPSLDRASMIDLSNNHFTDKGVHALLKGLEELGEKRLPNFVGFDFIDNYPKDAKLKLTNRKMHPVDTNIKSGITMKSVKAMGEWAARYSPETYKSPHYHRKI